MSDAQLWLALGTMAFVILAVLFLQAYSFNRSIDRAVASFTRELNTFGGTFDAKFKAIDDRFDAIDMKFGAVNDRFDALRTEMLAGFERLDARVDALDRDVQALANRAFGSD